MVDLLTWAYRREMVRFTGATFRTEREWLAASRVATAVVCEAMSAGFVGGGHGGAINARSSAHGDAERVHDVVRGLDRDDYWLVVRHAEAGVAPDWDPELPTGRLEPVLGKHGRPRMLIDPVSRRPIGCLVRMVGVGALEANRMRGEARTARARWYDLLVAMRDALTARDALERWRITGIGAVREPWAGHDGGLVAETC